MGVIRFNDLRKTVRMGCRHASSDGGHHACPMCGSVLPSALAQSPPAGTHTHWACSYWLLRAVSKHFSGTCSSVAWKLSGSSLPSADTSSHWGDYGVAGSPFGPSIQYSDSRETGQPQAPSLHSCFHTQLFPGVQMWGGWVPGAAGPAWCVGVLTGFWLWNAPTNLSIP